jgi:hypothetical protein
MLKPQLLNKFDRNDATIFSGRALIVRVSIKLVNVTEYEVNIIECQNYFDGIRILEHFDLHLFILEGFEKFSQVKYAFH